MDRNDTDLAYRMSRWSRYLHDAEVGQGGQLAEAAQLRDSAQWRGLTRELFGRLYGVGCERREAPVAGAEWAAELHRQADDIPEWQALRESVQGDAWRSGLVAATAAQVLHHTAPKRLPDEDIGELEAEAEAVREMADAAGESAQGEALRQELEALAERIAQARETADAALADTQKGGGVPLRSALRRAAAQAREDMERTDEALVGLGCGDSCEPTERRRAAQLVARDGRLARIAAIAGRLKAQAKRLQKTKATPEREELYGVTQGDELSRLLASEVGLLCREETRMMLLGRVAEKKALVYELRGRERSERGPILVAIDASGSMQGGRDEWAAACALTLLEVARMQGRAFGVLYFNGHVSAEHYVDDPTTVGLDAMLDLVGHLPGGGTNIGVALHRCADVIEGQGAEWKAARRSDVVLITDGDDCSDVRRPCDRLSKMGAALFTIAIESAVRPALRAVSEDCVAMFDAETGGASAKLDTVLSI